VLQPANNPASNTTNPTARNRFVTLFFIVIYME
jgi:hypothetical protein